MLRAAMSGAGEMWGSADYDRLAARLAAVHDEIVARLEPGPGVGWLDVATGTGRVAIRAARAGADVTGLDISPRLLAQARAQADGLPIRYDEGDAEQLPYEDASFDVVSSVVGTMFAPDHEAVARELARVCRSGGRLGLVSWTPNAELAEVYGRFGLDPPEGRRPFEWGRDEYVRALLGDSFELETSEGTWYMEAGSGEEVWEIWSTAAPPFRAMVGTLAPAEREGFHEAYVEYCERYRTEDGVAVPRRYLLVLGRRR
jgi:SAM-dependent methyltransferase